MRFVYFGPFESINYVNLYKFEKYNKTGKRFQVVVVLKRTSPVKVRVTANPNGFTIESLEMEILS